MTNLPKFDLSSMALKSDDELKDALKGSTGDGGKTFKPGKHEVTIQSSEFMGIVESDDTWARYRVIFEGAGGKTIRDTIMVPLKDITSFKKADGKTSNFPGRKCKQFLEAVGAEVTIKTLGDVLKTYFGKDNALVGLNLCVDVAYQGNHVKYLGKNAAGDMQLGLVNRKGERIDGTPTFGSYDEANKYAEDNSVVIKRFPDVDSYSVSSTPNKRPKADW